MCPESCLSVCLWNVPRISLRSSSYRIFVTDIWLYEQEFEEKQLKCTFIPMTIISNTFSLKTATIGFLDNEIYRACLRFFRNNNIVFVENLKIDLTKMKDDTVAYDYIMHSILLSPETEAQLWIFRQGTAVQKTGDTDFRIEEDHM